MLRITTLVIHKRAVETKIIFNHLLRFPDFLRKFKPFNPERLIFNILFDMIC